MKRSPRLQAIHAIAFLVCALLCGCSSGNGGTATGTSGNSVVATGAPPPVVVGMVNLARTGAPNASIAVDAVDLNGKLLASGSANSVGAFRLPVSLTDGRVRAAIPGALFCRPKCGAGRRAGSGSPFRPQWSAAT